MRVIALTVGTIQSYHEIPGMDTAVNLDLIPASYYAGPTIDVFDDRHNPKAWAEWFREFLEELLGAGQAVLKEARQRHPLLQRIEKNCRSAPLMKREWVLKLWKQAH